VVVNFLHVNGINYSINIYFSKIATTITASRKLVKTGRKFCLFVYYVELIGTKLWMAEEGVTLNGGLEIWKVEGRIRRGI
jgi:hypothetical protein